MVFATVACLPAAVSLLLLEALYADLRVELSTHLSFPLSKHWER
jgi:hypothetical protein